MSCPPTGPSAHGPCSACSAGSCLSSASPDPVFYIFAVLAIVLGFTADRNIKRYPDMLTGQWLAQAGAALGLIFGLGIFTMSTVQGMVRSRNAESFARYYAEVAKNRRLADMMWLGVPPSSRLERLPRRSDAEDDRQQEARPGGLRDEDRPAAERSRARLDSSKDQEIHFVGLEREGVDGLTQHCPGPLRAPWAPDQGVSQGAGERPGLS